MIKAIKSKVTDLIVNSLVTFVLVWIVAWILLFAG
jgi:hypothetical protein